MCVRDHRKNDDKNEEDEKDEKNEDDEKDDKDEDEDKADNNQVLAEAAMQPRPPGESALYNTEKNGKEGPELLTVTYT